MAASAPAPPPPAPSLAAAAAAAAAGAPWAMHPNIADSHGEVDGAIVPLRPLPFDNLLGAGSNTISAADAAAWLALHLHEGEFEGTRIVSRESLRAELAELLFHWRPSEEQLKQLLVQCARLGTCCAGCDTSTPGN